MVSHPAQDGTHVFGLDSRPDGDLVRGRGPARFHVLQHAPLHVDNGIGSAELDRRAGVQGSPEPEVYLDLAPRLVGARRVWTTDFDGVLAGSLHAEARPPEMVEQLIEKLRVIDS